MLQFLVAGGLLINKNSGSIKFNFMLKSIEIVFVLKLLLDELENYKSMIE